MFRFYCFLAYIIVAGGTVLAQSYAVKGVLLDSLSGQGLPLGTIKILKNGVLASVQESDKVGAFQFNNISVGNYTLTYSYVGYAEKQMELRLDKDTDLGNVLLAFENKKLNEVTVKAMKPMIVQELDRITLNVAETVAANNGNAGDILKIAPFVRIDNQWNALLKGKKVTFMIDGRLVNATGDALEATLAAIPSQSIDKIELISNPGAKYEASGVAIINIKTLKMRNYDTSGILTLGVGHGQNLQYSGGLQLNYKTAKTNWYGNLGFRRTQRYFRTENERTIQDNQLGAVYFNDHEFDKRKNNLPNFKLGVEHSINEKSSISFLVFGDNNVRYRTVNYTSAIGRPSALPDSSLVIDSYGSAYFGTFNSNLNFTHKISKEKELQIDFDWVKYWYDWREDINSYSVVKNNSVKNQYGTPWTNDVQFGTLRANYKLSLWGGIMEMGGQLRLAASGVNYQFYQKFGERIVPNTQLSSIYNYDEQVNGGYLNFKSKYKKVDYQLGLRVETTQIQGEEQLQQSQNKQSYVQLFPSASLQYSLSDNHQFSASISRKVSRPSFTNLNPRMIFYTFYYYLQGNPFLKPTISNSLELVHTYKQVLTTSFSYMYVQNEFFNTPTKRENLTVFLLQNYPSRQTLSIDMSLNKQLTKFWLTSSGFQLYYNWNRVNIDGVVNNNGAAYYFYAQNYFTLSKTVKFDITANYQPKIPQGIWVFLPWKTVDIGFTKSLLNKKADLRLMITDIFNINTARYQLNSATFNFYEESKIESRFVRATFTYRFGNNNIKVRDRKTGIESETKRIQ